jgi:DNA methylase
MPHKPTSRQDGSSTTETTMTLEPVTAKVQGGHATKSQFCTLVAPNGTPKPEGLVQRILHIASNPGDLVLDAGLGSGTTATVAMKMDRDVPGIEQGPPISSHCIKRLRAGVEGEAGGISPLVGWHGGGG